MTNKKNIYLGIDIGTQSTRVGLVDSHGKLIAVAGRDHTTIYPEPGQAEQEPIDWWKGICQATKECIQKSGVNPSIIKGISFDATSSTVLMVDKDGEPLERAIIWMDKRAVKEVEIIKESKHPILKYVGGQDAVEWMVPKALWLKRNKRQPYEKAYRIVEATDWISFKLTNKWTASLCNATCKWNYVSTEGGWCKEFFKEIGIPDILTKWPEIILPMGQLVGGLTERASRDLGIKSGIPVAEGGVDAHVGVIGLNALDETKLGTILGSSNVFFVLKNKPVFSEKFWGPYADAILRGKWLIESGQVSTGSIVNWFLDNFFGAVVSNAINKPLLLERLDKGVKEINPGAGGIITLDYWQGNRTPRRNPNAKGIIFGLTLGHNIYHLIRSIYEGISFGTRHIINALKENGIVVNKFVGGGGGTKSKQWLQIMSDVCELPIIIPNYAEHCCIIGSAICATCGAGEYKSLSDAAKKMVSEKEKVCPSEKSEDYDDFYEKYLELYELTKKLL